jgi:hypothetical protein
VGKNPYKLKTLLPSAEIDPAEDSKDSFMRFVAQKVGHKPHNRKICPRRRQGYFSLGLSKTSFGQPLTYFI